MTAIEEKLSQAVWVARTLFALGKTGGSTGNISFRQGDEIYISGGGTCFGTLTEADFGVVAPDGKLLRGKKPSKESPLHLSFYRKDPGLNAVIHTHGTYSVLWSCVPGLNEADCVPQNTPYLDMKLGKICMVPYEKPGSPELFRAFETCKEKGRGYLLKRHGALVGAESLMEAFYGIEELEESTRVAWELYRGGISF